MKKLAKITPLAGEITGYALISYAGLLISQPLGLALAGLAFLNLSLGKKR